MSFVKLLLHSDFSPSQDEPWGKIGVLGIKKALAGGVYSPTSTWELAVLNAH